MTLWMTPRLAVAVNFAQFVARASHSKLSLQKEKFGFTVFSIFQSNSNQFNN